MIGLKNFALDTSVYFGSTLLSENVIYNVQTVNLPGIDFSHPQLMSRTGALLNMTADQVTFNDLNLSILVDEKFSIWKEIMIKAFLMVTTPKALFDEKEGDSFIVVVDSQGNDLLKVWFRNSKLLSIGDLSYSSSNDNNVILLDLSLKYDYMDIEFDNVIISSNPNAVVKADAIFDNSGKPTGDILTSLLEI